MQNAWVKVIGEVNGRLGKAVVETMNDKKMNNI